MQNADCRLQTFVCWLVVGSEFEVDEMMRFATGSPRTVREARAARNMNLSNNNNYKYCLKAQHPSDPSQSQAQWKVRREARTGG